MYQVYTYSAVNEGRTKCQNVLPRFFVLSTGELCIFWHFLVSCLGHRLNSTAQPLSYQVVSAIVELVGRNPEALLTVLGMRPELFFRCLGLLLLL